MGPRDRKQQSLNLDSTAAKSLWEESKRDVWAFFCPNCRAERRLPFHPHAGRARHFLQVGISAAFFTLITWHWFSWKGFVSFLPFWAFFEIIYRSRVRAAIGCPHCGFDAYLYLADVKRARAEVENYWKKKFSEKGLPYPGSKALSPDEGVADGTDEADGENPALTEMRTGR